MAKAKSDARMQTKQLVEETLFESACTIKTRKKDLLKWSDDEEHLHQYRISVRTARSLVDFLKPYLKTKKATELKAALKELQDPTSRMRELDVLVPMLADEPELQEMCREAQLANRAEFIAMLKLPETQEKLAFVEDSLKHLAWKGEILKKGIDAEALAERLEEKRAYCEDTLATIDFDEHDIVHDLRKKAKALRYVSQEMAHCLPEGADELSANMKKVQDKLGEWCDASINSDLITEICGEAGQARAAAFQAEADAVMQELKDSRQQA